MPNSWIEHSIFKKDKHKKESETVYYIVSNPFDFKNITKKQCLLTCELSFFNPKRNIMIFFFLIFLFITLVYLFFIFEYIFTLHITL